MMRHAWSGILAGLGGLWLIVLAGLPLYVFPAVDDVAPSDVALVLGPPMQERLALAAQLRDDGVVQRIVVSVQPSGGQTADDIPMCDEASVTCVVADPYSTRGETQLVDAGESAIVITSTPHVTRARYLFDKCHAGGVAVVAAGGPETFSAWASQYAYQSAAFVKAIAQPCP